LIEDNIFWRLHTSIIVNRGSAGNVIAYNFSTNNYTTGNMNATPEDISFCHGAHPMFNLGEGNYAGNIAADSVWGSSSHSTLLRNYCAGANYYTTPNDVPYGASVSTPLPAPVNLLTYTQWEINSAEAFDISDLASFYNLVGNVAGSQWTKNNSTRFGPISVPQTRSLYNGYAFTYTYGYAESGTGTGARDSTRPFATAFIQGNWDIVTGTQQWTNMAPQTLPNSYYLSSKPAYFGILTWPPVDPANPSMCNLTNIPAGYRFVFGIDPPTGVPGRPVAMASATPLAGVAPLGVAFSSAGSYDPAGVSLSYLWTFGDGSTSTQANPSHTYQSVGTYSAQLQVSNGSTSATASPLSIVVTNAPALAAAASAAPMTGVAPLMVNFSSAGSAGANLAYNWNFGDGTTSTAANPSHTYQSAGSFTARLTVSSGTNTAASTNIVITTTVANPPPVQTGTNGLVAALGFEEGSGTTVTDVSGSGNHGTVVGATWVTGRYGYGLSFGPGAYVSIADSASLDLVNGVTMEAWVNPSSLSGWMNLVLKPQGSAGICYAFQACSSSGQAPSFGVTPSSSNLQAPSGLPLNTWTHVAATYDGATMQIYVNGVSVASRAQTGLLSTSADALTIGGNPGGENFAGIIDEVRVYNRALSPTEIQADMNAAVQRPPAPTGLRVVSHTP
jgi:PKD repeat protein